MNAQMIAMLVGAYLIGAVPFGLIVAKLLGVGDIRQQGSGNIGATNVLRVAGRKAGAVALLLDMGKGALVAWIAMILFGPDSPVTAATVILVFLGHLYPVYLQFKGGKGVAVALGALLAWLPLFGLILILIWLATAWWFRISSLAALVAFALAPLSLLWMTVPPSTQATLGVITLLVFWRHRANIVRLLKGTEPSIGSKKHPPDPHDT